MATAHLLQRKTTHFVLWRPHHTDPPPKLVIGRLQPGNPPEFVDEQQLELSPAPDASDRWEIAAASCNLEDGQVYHYWFEVNDSSPGRSPDTRIRCTDPTAWTVDWRLVAPRPPGPYGDADQDPASVVMFRDGALVACDPGGELPDWTDDASLDTRPANNRLVIYELPTSWSLINEEGDPQIGVGTFRDALALVEPDEAGANFASVAALEVGSAHLLELGVNALELLPPADSFVEREWGYATSNYFAPDHDLGFPDGHLSPTPSTDLTNLIKACHSHQIRFFADVVMAFATRYAYQNVNYPELHVRAGSNDPEAYNLGIVHPDYRRDAFGGDLFRYSRQATAYDPVSGQTWQLVPARRLMLTYLARWMHDFRIDGVRMDSVLNFASWDFIRDCKEYSRALWRERYTSEGHPTSDAAARFLVIGEELAVPLDLLHQQRLDALWNEHFWRLMRSAILGQAAEGEPGFEETVRKLIDCRRVGFNDLTQAVNYITSHDVEGFRRERLFNYLANNGVHLEKERRIKLAFACLLTAVGIPMILAGEEFADQHDLATVHPAKQIDAVNFGRKDEAWRRRIFDYVARLVKLRTSYDALAVNDTSFIHVDLNDGKQVLVWRRGQAGSGKQVVVVANFSEWGSPSHPGAEYVVPSWPGTPPGRRWREVTQNRVVPPQWVGREPLFPWEAKVYALEPAGP
jgi:pullulanase